MITLFRLFILQTKKVKWELALWQFLDNELTTLIKNPEELEKKILPYIVDAIKESNAKVLYICNLFTQVGVTDHFTVSDHINAIENYIGKNEGHAITYVPPEPEKIKGLMDNLISYINNPKDDFNELLRVAIIHAQFESIHPFMDGNGRVGRMLIPMYLYAKKQIDLPCFFISEALERDKLKYYNLLNNTRKENNWNAWIKFFLSISVKFINLSNKDAKCFVVNFLNLEYLK